MTARRLTLSVDVESRAFVSGLESDVIGLARAAVDAVADGRLEGFHLYTTSPGRPALALEPAGRGEDLARLWAATLEIPLDATCGLCEASRGGGCAVHRHRKAGAP